MVLEYFRQRELFYIYTSLSNLKERKKRISYWPVLIDFSYFSPYDVNSTRNYKSLLYSCRNSKWQNYSFSFKKKNVFQLWISIQMMTVSILLNYYNHINIKIYIRTLDIAIISLTYKHGLQKLFFWNYFFLIPFDMSPSLLPHEIKKKKQGTHIDRENAT